MSIKKFLIVLFLTVLAAASTEAAGRPRVPEGPAQLYTLDKAAPPQAGRPSLPNAAEEFLIQVSPAAVAANPPSFLIDLPGYAPLEAVRADFVDYQPGWKSWSGTLRHADNGETAGAIDIGFHGDRITALVELEDGERFRIVGGPEEGQRLVRLDVKVTPWSCGMDSLDDAVETPLRRRNRPIEAAPLGSEKILSCSANPRIDLLVVYPSRGAGALQGYFQMSAAEESALFTFVQNSVTKANQVFTNSRVNAWYNLVGVVPLVDQESVSPDEPPVPATGLQNALSWMNDEHAELKNLRNSFGADVVALYIPWAWSGDPNNNVDRACAVANLPRGDGNVHAGGIILTQPLNQRAFTAHRDTCGLDDLTLAHEIGHNYGMWHQNTYSSLLFPWARGHNFTENGNQRATVMGCNCTLGAGCVAGNFAVCNRISQFSDPDRTYNNVAPPAGVPIGARDANGNDISHNARVACDRVTGYSNFRSPSANTPPTASFTVSCAGRTCSFNASGSTDNLAIPVNNYWWDFGDGSAIARAGKSVSYTYAAAGTRRVHLVVKDSGGQTDVVWGSASPTSVLEGYHDSSNCSAIEGWAWDGTPSGAGATSVDVYRDSTKVATVVSNLYRQDVHLAGKGDGFHAFNYTPSSSWFDGQWHTATVKHAGTNTSLPGTGDQIICGASIFTSQTPAQFISTEGQVYTVGLQFSSNTTGYITQLGFYRAVGETGTNTLRLYTDGGTELASVTTSCSSSGWCWGAIPHKLVTANTRFRVTVNTNTYQSKTGCGFGSSGISNGPLTAHNGYWIAGHNYPTGQGACNSNFFLDVKFQM